MAVQETTARAVRPRGATLRLGALSDPLVRILTAAYVSGQLFDAVTTRVALGSGSFAEANPLFAGPLSSHPALAFAAKLLLAVAVLITALTLVSPRRRRVVLAVLALISVQAPLMNALRMAGIL
jgi:Domain of unknown function (DUF5658)